MRNPHGARDGRIRAGAVSVAAAAGLVAMKMAVGLATGSLALLADAGHSGLDLAASVVTLLAVRVAARPPDAEHLYGHGKVENLSALLQTAMLLGAFGWLLFEAIGRLASGAASARATPISFAVVLIAMAIDLWRARALRRAARAYGSAALEADALHFSSDILSSAVVLVGLAGTRLGFARADPVAAVLVGGLVIGLAARMAWRAVGVLVDAVPGGVVGAVEAEIEKIAGVLRVGRMRLRSSGPSVFADVDVAVDDRASFDEAHRIAERVEASIRRIFPRVDVVVYTHPAAGPARSIERAVREALARKGLFAHEINVRREGGGYAADLHLEFMAASRFEDAHRAADALERALCEQVPSLRRVNIHIDAVEAPGPGEGLPPGDLSEVRRLVGGVRGAAGSHAERLDRGRAGATLYLHLDIPGGATVADVHAITTSVEEAIKRRFPGITGVFIHAEPAPRAGQEGTADPRRPGSGQDRGTDPRRPGNEEAEARGAAGPGADGGSPGLVPRDS